MNDRIEFYRMLGQVFQRTYNPMDHSVAYDQPLNASLQATPLWTKALATHPMLAGSLAAARTPAVLSIEAS